MGPAATQSVMNCSAVCSRTLHLNGHTSRTSRQCMHGMEKCAFAFSSGTVAPSKKQHSRAHRPKLCARRSNVVVVRAAATSDIASATQQAITKTIGGDIFVAGGTGQLSARIIQELLRNGFKVTAGVQDAAEAQAGLEFAKRFEILKGDEIKRIRLQEVDLTDESSIAAALPRNARVLVAVGDNLGSQRADPQLLNRALAAAVSRDAQQFILVTPGVGGGGFLAGLFGGGATSSKQPSKTERQVAESGLDFVIVRAGKSDGVDPSLLESGVTVTPQGSLTNNAQVTKSQVAEVVAQVLLQSQTDVLIEVAADPDTPPSSVEAAVAQVLPQCSIAEEQQEEEEEDEEEQEQAPAPKAQGGLFGRTQQIKAQPQGGEQQNGKGLGGLFGGRGRASPEAPVGPQAQKRIDSKPIDAQPAGKQRGGFKQITSNANQQAEGVAKDAEDAVSKSPFGSLFGGGTKKIKQTARAAAEEAEDTLDKETSKPSSPLGGLFGQAKKAKKETEQAVDREARKPKSPVRGFLGGAKQATKEAEAVVDEGSSKASGPLGGLFGGAKKVKEQAQATAEEIAEDESVSPKNPLTGFFGGSKKVKAAAQQKTPSVQGARKSAAQGIEANRKRGKAALQRAGAAAKNGASDAAPKKKGGFLQALGFGQESVYVDDDK